MNRRAGRALAVTAVVLLAGQQCAPAARAVAPPPVDNSLLPSPAAPAPPEPTEQRGACAVPLQIGANHPRAAQLDGVDLQAIWRVTRGAGQRVAVIDTGVQPHRRLPGVVADHGMARFLVTEIFPAKRTRWDKAVGASAVEFDEHARANDAGNLAFERRADAIGEEMCD